MKVTHWLLTFELNGSEITVKANANKHIYHCDRWELIDVLFKAGLIDRTFSPAQMGHFDYLIKEAA